MNDHQLQRLILAAAEAATAMKRSAPRLLEEDAKLLQLAVAEARAPGGADRLLRAVAQVGGAVAQWPYHRDAAYARELLHAAEYARAPDGAGQPARDDVAAKVVPEVCTDDSIMYNVELRTLDGDLITFDCVTAGHADILAHAINECSNIDVEISREG